MSQLTKHLCINELTNLENGSYNKPIKILVVGTFNPAITKNEATWFYGREINEFWFLFPRMLGYPSVHAADTEDERDHDFVCKEFCEQHQVLIIDMIKHVNAVLNGYTDNEINTVMLDDVLPFDFKSAFEKNKPEKVIFTWKGSSGKVIGVLKKKFIIYLTENKIPYCEMPSASPIYRKGRKAKLSEWVETFKAINPNK
jgi:G:T/U-mismatch repair DNA glycosylase